MRIMSWQFLFSSLAHRTAVPGEEGGFPVPPGNATAVSHTQLPLRGPAPLPAFPMINSCTNTESVQNTGK